MIHDVDLPASAGGDRLGFARGRRSRHPGADDNAAVHPSKLLVPRYYKANMVKVLELKGSRHQLTIGRNEFGRSWQ